MAFLGLTPEFIQRSPKLLQTVALVGIKVSNYNTWERIHIVGSLGICFQDSFSAARLEP